MDTESQGIRLPIPGLGKLIFLGMAIGLGWLIWSTDVEKPTNPRAAKRQKLWSPDSNTIERIQAVEEWAAQGEFAIPELSRAIESPHDTVRATAVLALSRIGPLARSCTPDLIRLLEDPSDSVRSNAIHALIQIGDNISVALPALIKCLNDPSVNVRSTTEDALVAIGAPAVPAVCDFIERNAGDVRKHALTVLLRLRSNHELIERAAHVSMRDEVPEIRLLSLRILYMLDRFTIEEIISTLNGGDRELVMLALDSLSRRGPDARQAVPDVISLMRRELNSRRRVDEGIVLAAASTLGNIGPDANQAIPDLQRMIESDDSDYRMTSIVALSKITTGERLQGLLLEALRSERSPLVISTITGLLCRQFPELSPRVVTDLRTRLRTLQPEPVMLAASATLGLGAEAHPLAEDLGACLAHPRLPGNLIVQALGRIGPGAKSQMPRLIELLDVDELQTSLFQAIGRIQPDDEHRPRIIKAMKSALVTTQGMNRFGMGLGGSPLWEVDMRVQKRIAVFEAMGKLSNGHDEMADLLVKSTDEPDSNVRWTVIWSLAQLASKRQDAVDMLINSTSDNNHAVQATAILALGEKQVSPEIVIPIMIDFLKSQDPYLRTAAATTLARYPKEASAALEVLNQIIADDRNKIINIDTRMETFWTRRRLPAHLHNLHLTSPAQAALLTLSAIDEQTAKSGSQDVQQTSGSASPPLEAVR